jgi:hypothetical protein
MRLIKRFNWRVRSVYYFAAAGIFSLTGSTGHGDLAMETETARVLEPGHFEIGTAFEFQTSPNGKEYALPMAIEFGVFHHLEVLIEPVPFTSIHPKTGASATGVGDLETTLCYLIIEEKKYVPALAIAGEIKFPTAQNTQIGSGEYDYRFYAVASKRFGNVDLHINLGYNIVGAPSGQTTNNPIDAELGAEWFVHPKFDLFAEANYIGSSSPNGGEGATPTGSAAGAPEIGADEVIASVGIRFHLASHVDTFGSFSYDNNSAKLFRIGATLKY